MCVPSSRSRIPNCLASTTIERPSGVSSASEASCAASASSTSLDARHRHELGRLAVAERDRAGLVQQQHVDVAARLDRAAGQREHVAAHEPVHAGDADRASSAPIVVGMSATNRATRVVMEMVVPANSANGRSATITNRNTSVRPASRMLSAISFGVLRRSAPSTSAIMRSRKDLPGSCVISTTIRSESTRVPPVTAERSPPDSRMTGADSPVIADSSTEAMPSITVPSPGITSPASTTTRSPRASSDAARDTAVGQPRRRLGAHRAQRGGLRAAAALGQRLGEVGEDDREPEPDGHGEGEPRGLVAAAERLAAGELDEPRDRGDQRADLDHEHDRVPDLHAGVELLERGPDRRPQDLRREQGLRGPRRRRRRGRRGRLQCGHRVRASLSSVVFTPGSPITPRKRPSVLASMS